MELLGDFRWVLIGLTIYIAAKAVLGVVGQRLEWELDVRELRLKSYMLRYDQVNRIRARRGLSAVDSKGRPTTATPNFEIVEADEDVEVARAA